MVRSRLLSNVALSAASLLLVLAVAEMYLRIVGYRFAPLALVVPGASDHRSYHLAAVDPRVSPNEPVTLFDPVLLWRLNPAASFQVNDLGLRGLRPTWPRDPGERLVLVLGDSNTLGPLHEPDHWPGQLQHLLDLGTGRDRFRVANAGVYGYSSFQGLRRFRELMRYHPDVVIWSFGANDAHRVSRPDREWAARAARLRGLSWSRLVQAVVQRLWGGEAAVDGRAAVPRVAPEEYRAHLEEFVSRARGAGARPVLVTRPYVGETEDPGYWMTHAPAYNTITREVARARGAELVDAYEAFRDEAEAFLDESHLNRRGQQRLARIVAESLSSAGVLPASPRYASEVALGTAPEWAPELGDGWWRRERWGDTGGGRWTQARATVTLERAGGEAGLRVDATVAHPTKTACGAITVDGREIERFCWPDGRKRATFALPPSADGVRQVTLVLHQPFVPAHVRGAVARDERTLGLFVHEVALVARPPAK